MPAVEETRANINNLPDEAQALCIRLAEALPEDTRGGAWSHYRIVHDYLTAADKQLVKAMGWDDRAFGKEIAHAQSVLAQKRLAGTPEDRNRARDEHREALQLLEEERPALEQAIADARSTLAALEGDAAKKQRAVESQFAAVQRLRAMVPLHVKDRHRTQRLDLHRQMQDELRNLGNDPNAQAVMKQLHDEERQRQHKEQQEYEQSYWL